MHDDAHVRLVGVTKRYDGAAAVDDITLAFKRGATAALIGPSGCGKSTLLRLIIGLVQPDAGAVEYGGKPIRRETIDTVRHRVGYVIQDGGLFPHLTARGNVELLPKHLRQPGDSTAKRIADLCELTRFPTSALDRYPVELSGGQRQRVGLMRALAMSPELLLLDEPLGALDPIVRASLQQDLKRIFSELGQTAILVTHDLAEAAYLAGDIVLMNAGTVVQRGSLHDLRDRPATPFVREFIEAQRTLV